MRLLSPVVGRASNRNVDADNEYRKFAEKCLRLQKYIKDEFKVRLTPRELDNLLLYVHAKNANLRFERGAPPAGIARSLRAPHLEHSVTR